VHKPVNSGQHCSLIQQSHCTSPLVDNLTYGSARASPYSKCDFGLPFLRLSGQGQAQSPSHPLAARHGMECTVSSAGSRGGHRLPPSTPTDYYVDRAPRRVMGLAEWLDLAALGRGRMTVAGPGPPARPASSCHSLLTVRIRQCPKCNIVQCRQ
jgi:hypothetical protein